MVTLLRFTALRSNAIRTLKLADVWDQTKNDAQPLMHAIEKFSEHRLIPTIAAMQAAIRNYVTSDYKCENGEYLFGTKRKPEPPVSFVRYVLNRVCKRCDLPPINAHKFRTYVTTKIQQANQPIENASALLGHKNVQTTDKHYNDPENLQRLMEMTIEPFNENNKRKRSGSVSSSGMDSKALQLWEQDREEVKRLRVEIMELKGVLQEVTSVLTDDQRQVLRRRMNLGSEDTNQTDTAPSSSLAAETVPENYFD